MRFIVGRSRFRPSVEAKMLLLVLTSALALTLLWGSPAHAQDLSITKEGPERVGLNQQFDYTLTVSDERSSGSDRLVTVTDRLPSGVGFRGPPDSSSECVVTGTPDEEITCTIAALPAGAERVLTLAVTAPDTPRNIRNRATVRLGAAGEPIDSDRVTTKAVPRLTINKQAGSETVNTEGRIIYTLQIENNGGVQVPGVTVRDKLPDGVNFISVSTNGFQNALDCDNEGNGLVRCTGNIAPNDVGTVTIIVEPERTGTLRNTAEVFVSGLGASVDSDTETTTVRRPNDGDNGGNGGGGNGGGGNGGGDCTPIQSFRGDTQVNETLTLPSGSNRLRIVYATLNKDGRLDISVGRASSEADTLDEVVRGAKAGVFGVRGFSAKDRVDLSLDPTDQDYRVVVEAVGGSDDCTDPRGLFDVLTVADDDSNIIGIPDDELPETGGVPLPVLAGCAALLLVGTAVVGAAVRRRS